MTADMTRQEVRFIRWDVPDKKQEDLPDPVRNGKCGRVDAGNCVLTALGETAVALWDNGGDRVEYVTTMPKGTDGDLRDGFIPEIFGTSGWYNRKWLTKILSNMTSDAVRIRIDDDNTMMVMRGLVGDKEAAAILAPRVEDEE